MDERAYKEMAELLTSYRTVCNTNNLTTATVAAIMGISATRVNQLADAPRPVVSVVAFLRVKYFFERLEEAISLGVLPAQRRRGEPQQRVVDFFC